jgi:hypothetical protein
MGQRQLYFMVRVDVEDDGTTSWVVDEAAVNMMGEFDQGHRIWHKADGSWTTIIEEKDEALTATYIQKLAELTRALEARIVNYSESADRLPVSPIIFWEETD